MTKIINHSFKYRRVLMFLGAILLISISACKNETKVDCDSFHWGYEGNEAPDQWASCYTDCGGQAQSPVAITGEAADESMTSLGTHYEDVPIDLINNGHTIEFEYHEGSILSLDGEDYTLLQFHFHTGSEHTINGTQFPMEAHLVHQNSEGGLAVIGIMFEEGSENAFLKNFSDHLPAMEDDHYSSDDKVNVTELIPPTGGYFTYSGSLTTPPCSEIVTWIVMKTPMQASAAQIAKFKSIMHDNFRPVQPLNGRTVSDYDCSDFHWGYSDHGSPEFWAECNPDCDGNNQSPINITGAVADNSLNALETHYESVPIELINNGHTIEFEYEAGSTLKLNGDDYTLLQFHFHTGSEHSINGTQFPMEAHLVHKNSAGALAVIGIMFEEGSENAFLKNFSDHLPEMEDDHYSSDDHLNMTDLFPAGTGYYTYSGSLTTPPCSESVSWFVMKDPIEASADQLSKFSNILHDNYRPVQDLNSREINSFN